MNLVGRMKWTVITLLIAMAGTDALRLLAQSGTSSALAGTLADRSAAVVPNAQVTASEVNTGAARTVQSNSEGRFLFSQINPGTYRIEVRAPGFAVVTSQ